jgi:hypothetical protein
MGLEGLLRDATLAKNDGPWASDVENGGFNAYSAASTVQYEGQILAELIGNMFGSGRARSTEEVGRGRS